MPHIIVEYSANLEDAVDIAALVGEIHQAAISTGEFPPAGTRTRAARRDIYAIADQHPDNVFLNIKLMIGEGRDVETRHKAGAKIFDAASDYLDKESPGLPLALSLNIWEINKETSFKKNNLHEIIAARTEGTAE